MTTVNWERLGGDEVERFVAAALTKDRGGGCRITPSSGDGGIDVLLPNGDGTWEVVQIKRYTGPLDSKQKDRVRESWDRFIEQELPHHAVTVWTLAMPWDPSREALEWLQGLPPETPYAKNWMGRTRLDVLAAENPQLVAYYFGDGASRVQELLTLGIEAGRPTTSLVESDLLKGVLTRHEALAKVLDEIDPFYSYEIAVRAGKLPTEAQAYAAAADGAAMVQFATIDTDRYVTMRVIPTHPLASQLRPIRQTIRFEATPGTAEHQMLEDFATYGTPLQNVVGEVIDATGPPGTATTGRSLFSLTPISDAEFPPLELRALDETGVAVASLPLLPPQTSSGLDGEHHWLTTTDPSGLVTLEMRIGGTDRKWELNLRHGALTGQPAVEASKVGDFYRPLEASHALSLAQVGGMELLAPFQLSGPLTTEPSIWEAVAIYARLQRHTPDRVLLPDFGRVTTSEFVRLQNVVSALEGMELELHWQPISVTVPEGRINEFLPFVEASEPFEALQVFEIEMPIAGVDVSISNALASRMLNCRLDRGEQEEMVVLSPTGDDRALLVAVDDSFDVGLYLGTSGLEASGRPSTIRRTTESELEAETD